MATSSGPYPFEPDWILSPGTILLLELTERGVTEAQFAELSGLGPETVSGLFAGTVKIGGVIASRIARVIGTSGTMWLNLQATYDAALARGAQDVSGDYGKDREMGEMDAAARAAGIEVEARCSIAHGADALLELAGEDQPVRWPLSEVAEALGLAPRDVPGTRMLVTVRESAESGRVLSGFRPLDRQATRAEAAAAWWASRLGNATHNVGMGNVSEMDLTISLNLDTVRGSRTPAEQERFREALEAVIGDHLRDCETCAYAVPNHHEVKVDYDPDDLLFAAAARAGIDMQSRELPAKTLMVFKPEWVRVSEGYGAPYLTIWGREGAGLS